MKKKIILLFIFTISIFIGITNINADYEVNANLGNGENSKTCSSDYCASTVYGYYGLRVTLMYENSSGNLVNVTNSVDIKNTDFTFTKPTNCDCGGNYCTSANSDSNFCWKDYFNNLTATELERILKQINSSYSLSNTSNYYLVVVPLVKIAYTNPKGTFYFSGTHNEVISGMRSYTNYGGATASNNNWYRTIATHFTERNGATSHSGNYVAGPWNVLKNFYTAFKMDKAQFQYTTTYTGEQIISMGANSFKDSFDNSIYGKIIIKISDYQAKLKIKKVNSSNDELATLDKTTTPKFELYSNSSCTGTPIADFGVDDIVSGLDAGTYYLKEYQTKKGYHLPTEGEKWFCEPITLTAGITNEIKVENKTECEYRFKNNMTMKERIVLYNDIQTDYDIEFNALLNLNNTTAVDACKNIPNQKNYNKSCLASSSTSTNSSSFSQNNVSMYTEKHGKYTFCLTTYNLVNNLGINIFSNIKSGRPIINTETPVSTATLRRICYNYGDSESDIPDLSYSNYVIEEPTIDGESFIKEETESGTLEDKTITVEYTLPLMYASNKDGRVYYGYCPTGESCKIIGNGIISKFNLKPDTYTLNFNIRLNNLMLGNLSDDTNCTYNIKSELITPDSQLQLEFRTIDTANPFSGKFGATRTTGANWCDDEGNCSGDSSNMNVNMIINSNNSYNKTKEGAKYVIELTPSDIKLIRDYNKLTPYDDYTLNCDANGENCTSRFLQYLKNGTLYYYDVDNDEEEYVGIFNGIIEY